MKRIGIYNVRIVKTGERFGLNDCMENNETAPLVEFYDARQSQQKFGPRGQFVWRYYLDTLRNHPGPVVLDSLWPTVSAEDLCAALDYAKQEIVQA